MTADVVGAWPAVEYDAWFERPFGRYASAVETAAVLRALGPLPGRRVLDAGCGTGRLLLVMAGRGATAVGVDRDLAMLALARARAGPLVRGDVGGLPLRAASLDAVVAVAVLEFVADPAAVVAEMCRVTRRGGRVVVGALNPRSAWGVARWRELRRPPWAAARFFGRAELRRLGRPYGRARLRGLQQLAMPCVRLTDSEPS
jgi:SAM-dependent methyltransferase